MPSPIWISRSSRHSGMRMRSASRPPCNRSGKWRAEMDRRQFVIGGAASAAAIWTHEAAAQDAFPSRPITIINAFPPGGINDLVTRPAASALEGIFKQPVVVEAKTGAAGAVGAQVAANGNAGGHHRLLPHHSNL